MSESDGTLKDATPRVDVAKEVVSLSVVEDTVEKEKLSPIVTTTESYPLLPTQVTTSAGNTLGNSSYAKVTGNPSGKKLNFRTLFTPGVMGLTWLSCSIEGLDAMLENGPYSFLSVRMASSYVRAMIELRADVELKDNIMAAMPKITREDYYTCNIHVEYEWKPPRCVCCKVFGHVLEECPKNIGAGATKNLKKTSQTPKGIPVGQKMGFKPKHVFQPVLTSVVNDVDLSTNGGISNSADKGTINVSYSNTPIAEKIDKIERQIYEDKLRFVDDDGNPLVPRLVEQMKGIRIHNRDYDLYDDDMCENHDMSEHLQSICNDLDIMVPGRKKN
ncbi:hypothetical protein Tco_1142423 [Tanacetum coccineum]